MSKVSTMKKRHEKSGQGRCFALVHLRVIPGRGSEGFNHISATSLLWILINSPNLSTPNFFIYKIRSQEHMVSKALNFCLAINLC